MTANERQNPRHQLFQEMYQKESIFHPSFTLANETRHVYLLKIELETRRNQIGIQHRKTGVFY